MHINMTLECVVDNFNLVLDWFNEFCACVIEEDISNVICIKCFYICSFFFSINNLCHLIWKKSPLFLYIMSNCHSHKWFQYFYLRCMTRIGRFLGRSRPLLSFLFAWQQREINPLGALGPEDIIDGLGYTDSL